jgi:Domain of unknown function (DUF4440)
MQYVKTDDIWQLETAFWTANPDEVRHALDPHCLMGFPSPAGIVAGDQIISSMRAAPRWRTVAMVEKYLQQPAADLVVLAYFVSARRNGGGAYTAYCTSTYRQDQSGWKLIQHQQTPT